MKKPVLKAYYKDIFFEFMVHDKPADTILLLEGFPSSSTHAEQIQSLNEKGYNVFVPHYKGTYQSKGKFLESNIVQDMKGFVEEMRKNYAINLWDMSKVEFKIKKLILFGASFSGAICCGLSTLIKFDKIVLFSPVLDYSRLNENGDEQDPNHLIPFVKRAYENLFRIEFKSLTERMNQFKECSPQYYLPRIKCPLLILHDPNDKTVSIRISREIVKKVKKASLIESKNGHKMENTLNEKWKTIDDFIKK